VRSVHACVSHVLSSVLCNSSSGASCWGGERPPARPLPFVDVVYLSFERARVDNMGTSSSKRRVGVDGADEDGAGKNNAARKDEPVQPPATPVDDMTVSTTSTSADASTCEGKNNAASKDEPVQPPATPVATTVATTRAMRTFETALLGGKRTDKDVGYVQKIKKYSKILVRTGDMDALNGTWKFIQSTRSHVGPHTFETTQILWDAINHPEHHVMQQLVHKAHFKPDVYLESVQLLLESLEALLGEDRQALVAAAVAKLATYFIMCLAAYKKIQSIAQTVSEQYSKSYFFQSPSVDRHFPPIDQDKVKEINDSVAELIRIAADINPSCSPTNGLLLELSLIEYGAKSLYESHVAKEVVSAGGEILLGVVQTVLHGGFPDQHIWEGLKHVAVTLHEHADELVANAVFTSALFARSKTLELMNSMSRSLPQNNVTGAAFTDFRATLGNVFQKSVTASKYCRQVVRVMG
jgi:hypothetical protein